jgi:hypothetical protein
MRVTRFLPLALALGVLLVGTTPAVAAADSFEGDCEISVPEDPDCDGDYEQPNPGEYGEPGGDSAGGSGGAGDLIGALVDLIGSLF